MSKVSDYIQLYLNLLQWRKDNPEEDEDPEEILGQMDKIWYSCNRQEMDEIHKWHNQASKLKVK